MAKSTRQNGRLWTEATLERYVQKFNEISVRFAEKVEAHVSDRFKVVISALEKIILHGFQEQQISGSQLTDAGFSNSLKTNNIAQKQAE